MITEIGFYVAGPLFLLWYFLMARSMHVNGRDKIEGDEVDRFLGIAKTAFTASGIGLVLLVNEKVSMSSVSPLKIKAAPIFLLLSVILGLSYMVVLSRQFQLNKGREEDGTILARIPIPWWYVINFLSLVGLYLFLLGLCAITDIVWGLPYNLSQ